MTCLYCFLIHLEGIYITSVVTGHGLSGILLNLTRFVTLLIYDLEIESNVTRDKLSKSFFILFYLAGFFMLINILIWYKLKDQKDIKRAIKLSQPDLTDDKSRKLNEDQVTPSPTDDFSNNLTELEKIKKVLQSQSGINIAIFIHGAITYTVFPGIIIKNKVFTNNGTLSFLYIMIIFNFFDIIGRQIAKFIQFKRYAIVYILVLMRLLFILLFPFIYEMRKSDQSLFYDDDYFLVAMLSLMAFSNGYFISISFILIHTDEINEVIKSKASSVLSVTLNSGIYLGSTLAYLLNYLVK
jgi:hypothetical protein